MNHEKEMGKLKTPDGKTLYPMSLGTLAQMMQGTGDTKDQRAFGAPSGTVRAILTIANTVIFGVGLLVALFHGGVEEAAIVAGFLGPITGVSTAQYFGMGRKQ